ncbi:MAG: hypothetical protein M1830_010697 [Pleopsidium flavum]|nr:MAG: hypothetical protein M1830_010697 [Pleopsidium flavum]
MFRNPRENASSTVQTSYKPSTGRPPTPPPSSSHRDPPKQATPTVTMTSSTMPLLGRSRTLPKTTGRALNGPIIANGKTKGKPNSSILNFFKKAEPIAKQSGNDQSNGTAVDSLFLGGSSVQQGAFYRPRSPTPDDLYDDTFELSQDSPKTTGAVCFHAELSRFHENGTSIKRRKLDSVSPVGGSAITTDCISLPEANGAICGRSPSEDEVVMLKEEACSPPPPDFQGPVVDLPSNTLAPAIKQNTSQDIANPPTATSSETILPSVKRRRGPFIEDSDSDDDTPKVITGRDGLGNTDLDDHKSTNVDAPRQQEAEQPPNDDVEASSPRKIQMLKQESINLFGDDGFDGIEDFGDDEFPEEGEEYIERRWMEEQRIIEMGLEDEECDDLGERLIKKEVIDTNPHALAEEASSCPICSVSFACITDSEASVHVNHCLDGNPTPLPDRKPVSKSEPSIKIENGVSTPKRFQRAAIAKPGQENPFVLGASNTTPSSAFSKLMSSHAEDAAWATAAASEVAARGKPAYQRTCPFYKILPGLFICVDAFRYGAVEGCKAYFLSHFHSDHYVGLTSSWCHGPIYCSHVTANLVRQQLRVDPKWVVDLDFDQKVEVSETQGVAVTMIPANHCPGSSLYLFEKVIGKGKNPKVQRVLHCGDFRACPAHVQHPLLRPDITDLVSRKQVGQQKIDVCYLDTTYLTPKYAFPSQEEVIKACADMCVSLSKDRINENDDWEQTKKERAGSGMVKFVRKNSDLTRGEEDEDDIDAMKVNAKSGKKSRGRLLVIVGTYSIGKERICLGVARALNSKIYAPPNKQKICACLDDPELMARLTSNPLEAQVHMQMLMEIRAETLADYLTGYKPHFSRIVGFRPSGWNYRPPNSRFVESPAVQTVLNSENWKSRYSMAELVPQRGSTREASCFGVPYSEHSSFRELTMFCCALRIDKIIPTVNVGSAKSREKMKSWIEKWQVEKKKNGLFRVADEQTAW